MKTKKYLTQPERRARRKLVRILKREYVRKIRSMMSSFMYSGDVYMHQVDELNLINQRITSVYYGENDE